MPRNDSLDPDKIGKNLRTKRIGRKVAVYDCTSSTNDIAAEFAGDKKNDGMAIFAEEQTDGRGRGGNSWYSSRAENILVSIILAKDKLDTELLSLTFAVAVAEAVGTRARIKWPNDIIVNGKKVAGILLESKPDKKNSNCVIGIGINCHQNKDSFPAELREIATSMDIENGSYADRNSLAKRVLTSIDHWLKTADKDSGKVVERWRQLSIQLGHRVTVIFNGKSYCGNCIGVDPQKGLILQLDRGGVRMFDAAHTSIAVQNK